MPSLTCNFLAIFFYSLEVYLCCYYPINVFAKLIQYCMYSRAACCALEFFANDKRAHEHLLALLTDHQFSIPSILRPHKNLWQKIRKTDWLGWLRSTVRAGVFQFLRLEVFVKTSSFSANSKLLLFLVFEVLTVGHIWEFLPVMSNSRFSQNFKF